MNKPLSLPGLIASKLKEHNLSRKELITQIGYTNTTKGLRRLDHFLRYHNGPEEFIKKLIKILDIDALEFHKSMTFSQKEITKKTFQEKKDSFSPYIDLIFDYSPRHLIVNNFIFNSSHYISTEVRNLPLQEEIDAIIIIYKDYINQICFRYFSPDFSYVRYLCKPTPEENQRFRECVIGFRYYRQYAHFLEFNADCILTKIESRESLPDKISNEEREIIENLRSIYPRQICCWC